MRHQQKEAIENWIVPLKHSARVVLHKLWRMRLWRRPFVLDHSGYENCLERCQCMVSNVQRRRRLPMQPQIARSSIFVRFLFDFILPKNDCTDLHDWTESFVHFIFPHIPFTFLSQIGAFKQSQTHFRLSSIRNVPDDSWIEIGQRDNTKNTSRGWCCVQYEESSDFLLKQPYDMVITDRPINNARSLHEIRHRETDKERRHAHLV